MNYLLGKHSIKIRPTRGILVHHTHEVINYMIIIKPIWSLVYIGRYSNCHPIGTHQIHPK